MVLAAGPELIEDVRKAPDDVLNMLAPIIEVSSAQIEKLMLIGFTSAR
jgi:hypothetical protein